MREKWCIILVLACLTCSRAAAPVYFVDAVSGDDSNSGRSPAGAWKTLAPVNALQLEPGSRILLRAGGEYEGPLNLTGSGALGSPNTVGSYGEGPKPHILRGPGSGPVVSLYNGSHWEIADLEISGGTIGVFAYMKEFGIARSLHFRRLDIHDVRGSLTGDDGGFLLKREGEETWFDDLLIENCTIERVDRNGILLTDYPTAKDTHHSTGVVIRGNHLRDIGGDGIFILGCDGAVIEHNVLRYAHQRVGRRPGERACAGIWPHRCNDTLIQFNEVSHTAVGGVTVWDSEAFDDDVSCRGTVFQYNYSHHNAGGFLLMCAGSRGTIVRYNVSENDAVATFTLESDGTGGATIHNNTIYVGPELSVTLFRNTSGAPDTLRFVNNIVHADGQMVHSPRGITGITCSNNAWFGNIRNRPEDPAAILSEPGLIAPGTGGEGFGTIGGYRLVPDSPCRGAGTAVPGDPGIDLFGNARPDGGGPWVGACHG
ncbi:MAG: right-handed parallel beta-helix repeat-containing protein [Armatimonadetes bacterium]|nr:right-handed parallel beta-helix repeat-containing protein [Armatimonadota bacterium]